MMVGAAVLIRTASYSSGRESIVVEKRIPKRIPKWQKYLSMYDVNIYQNVTYK